ncbi:uncharacterized protein LOC143228355 [Tachypleus tridentatus]|uniref:uncharacterized protein LOC143228355 n=1 Tax=Tachypleus tridentatus TaxID=6853 RepID=UPI003FD600BF
MSTDDISDITYVNVSNPISPLRADCLVTIYERKAFCKTEFNFILQTCKNIENTGVKVGGNIIFIGSVAAFDGYKLVSHLSQVSLKIVDLVRLQVPKENVFVEVVDLKNVKSLGLRMLDMKLPKTPLLHL